jgi:hypothetical protein
MSGSSGYNPITKVNVSQQNAPLPNQLQRTGAVVSQGGTTLTPGTYSLLTQPSSLTSLLSGVATLSGIVQTAGTATATLSTGTLPTGETLILTVMGASGGTTAYNGTFTCTVASATTFTYAVPTGTPTPATTASSLTYTPEDVAELNAMTTTFFAQGSGVGVYVLELGLGDAVHGIAALTTFITANPNKFYSYLLPHDWGIAPTFYSAFAINFTSDTAKTYFHVTTTLAYWQANPTVFAATLKCLVVSIEAPAVAVAFVAGTPTEFSAAAFFYVTLNLNPSPGNQVTQAAFSYLFGVTPYPVVGNSALFVSMETANINIVGTGAEGGITTAIELYGTTLDGNDFNKYWYSVDNVQLTLDLNTSNAVINGSNNPLAPLNYNQAGINTLQSVAGNTMQTEIATGLALGQLVYTQLTGTAFAQAYALNQFAGQVVVNAIPFVSFVTLESGDYAEGIYAGLAVAYTVQLGFRQIIYNVSVSNFI